MSHVDAARERVTTEMVPTAFQDIAERWFPGPVTAVDVLTADGPARLAALFDLPSPVVEENDVLPPLWYWLFFLPTYRREQLGDDGHPAEGDFLPPLPQRRRMFGGGRLEVHKPLRCGERVTRRSELRSVKVRRGASGSLLLTTVRHELAVDDELRVVEEQDHVYRQAGDVGRTPRPEAVQGAPPEGTLRLSFPTDPVTLFRFSAVTVNAHRIHYDEPYTTQVEGYPGLVVQGPLVALLLLELPRRAGLAVRSFSWRAKAPLFSGQTVELVGALEDTDLALWAGADGSWERMIGTAEVHPVTDAMGRMHDV